MLLSGLEVVPAHQPLSQDLGADGGLTSVGSVMPVLEQLRAGVVQDMDTEFQAFTGRPMTLGSFKPREPARK